MKCHIDQQKGPELIALMVLLFYRESMMDPFSRTVITKFMSKVQRDIRDAVRFCS